MKSIINISLLTFIILLAAGCKKSFVDQDPYNASIVESLYFTTQEQCNTSTQANYNNILYGSWWQRQNFRFLSGEATSDNAWIGNTYQSTHANFDVVAFYTLDAANDRVEAHWVMTYKSIGVINHTIGGIEGAAIDENAKNQYLAELKFMRSYLYLDLVRNWGDIPLILKVESPSTKIPRSKTDVVYTQLISDLKQAANVLPRKSQYSPKDKFRVSKGAALALLAKIYLYKEDWANAEIAAKQVVDMGEYALEPQFGNLWSYTNKNGIESILEAQYSSIQTPGSTPSNGYISPMNCTADGGWGYISVTSDLENAFKSENDSIRRVWTINVHQKPVAGDPDKPSFDGRPTQSKSARFSRKRYVPVAQRPANGRYGFNDILLRLGDVILVHAEACAMQNKASEALNSLKMIRDRAGLITNMTLTGQVLIDAVRKERRLETALEGDRLYDLRRWKDASGQPYINKIFGPNGSFVLYNTQTSTDPWETTNTIEPQDKGKSFNPAIHRLWPIPNVEITASEGVVTQNPGY